MIPSIEAAKKLSKILDVTVGYLVGENEDSELFKDIQMLERFKELNKLPEKDKIGILYALDGLLRDAKTRQSYIKQ